jgi:hypothetical protein
MKSFRFIAALALVAAATPLAAQEVIHRQVEIAEPGVPPHSGATWVGGSMAGADAVFVHGSGIRFEGPPKKGAPYSAEAVTETTQSLSDGNRIRRENRAMVYRDSEGRTRREEKLGAVGPWAVAGEQPTRIFINDPVAGEHWVLEPENKIARKMKLPSIEQHVNVSNDVNVNVTIEAAGGGPGPILFEHRIERGGVVAGQAGPGASFNTAEQPNVEDLGTRTIEGVDAHGSKITRTIPAGEIGNELPIEVVFERWHSEDLGVDVMTRRSDPRSAETTYKLTNIQRTEPLPGLFQPPPDYEVKEPGADAFIRRTEKKDE